jgi:MFS family permease
MDLKCKKSAEIGFLITAYFIGYVIGGLFCTFPDKYGRKKSLIFGLCLSCIA